MTRPTHKYLFLHRSEPAAGPAAPPSPPSPEQLQAMFAAWTAWKEQVKDRVVDWGDKLRPGGKIVAGPAVTDGPLMETKEVIGGYMIVAADSIEEAVAIAQGMPAGPGARIEIRELAGAQM